MADYIEISDRDGQVTRNFSYRELFNPKNGLTSHPLDRTIIEAVQFVRDYFGVPIRITSTYRNYIPSGGVTNSPHMKGLAIDFEFILPIDQEQNLYLIMRDDFDQNGDLFKSLFDMGVRGFGSYDGFVHLDTRVWAINRTYQGVKYQRWNNMKVLKYRSPETFVSANGLLNDGISNATNSITQTSQEIAGVIVGTLSSFMYNREDGLFAGFSFKTVAIMVLSFLFIVLSVFGFKILL